MTITAHRILPDGSLHPPITACPAERPGDPNCHHDFASPTGDDVELISTGIPRQHRRCRLCGRVECTPVCRPNTPCSQCSDPLCSCLCHTLHPHSVANNSPQ